MASELYDISIPLFIRHLNGLAECMTKTQTTYTEKKCDEKTLLCYRLYPDMFDFTKQVQLATDHPRTFAALISGLEAPKYEDDETSLADLIDRCESTSAWLESLKREKIDGAEEKGVTVKRSTGDVTMQGRDLLLGRILPNFFFHCTTAYNILRHNGIAIGKTDFMAAWTFSRATHPNQRSQPSADALARLQLSPAGDLRRTLRL